jgi:glycosyltransferase involved in cell wall biosynthesis
MKIALVTSWNVKCGIATYSADLANALAQEDVEVYVARMSRFGRKSPEIMLDTADRIPYEEVDLVHVQHEYGIWQGLDAGFFTAMRIHGKPIVTTMHAVGNWQIDVLISSVSNKVIVHNKFCASRFPFPNVEIIPHGVAPSEPTAKESAKPLMQIAKDAPVVGYLGFISSYKGLENLIMAMTKVSKVGLMICGGWHVDVENEYIGRLQAWSKKLLGNRVMWMGYIPDEKLADAYGAMDVLVYPSRFATESGALLHGIAYGKAIIASNVEPFKEKEREEAILTFKDADDLAEKIKWLLNNREQREQLEQGAREYAKRNSWASVAKRHVELYQKLLEPAPVAKEKS